MSNSTDANFLLQAFETRFYIILLGYLKDSNAAARSVDTGIS